MKVIYFDQLNRWNLSNMIFRYIATRNLNCKHFIWLILVNSGNMVTTKKKWPEVYSEPSQTSKMELFVKIVNGCQLFFCKKLHFRCFTLFWIRLWILYLHETFKATADVELQTFQLSWFHCVSHGFTVFLTVSRWVLHFSRFYKI